MFASESPIDNESALVQQMIWYPWWRNQMEIFSRYWPFVREIHRSPVNSPHKGQLRWALMFSVSEQTVE